jgi:prephenate dehydratase
VERVAFQGALGAFSQQAVYQLLGEKVEVVPCQRFDEVFQALAGKKADAAVVPLENTLHGSVHENYDHLLQFELPIVGETSVRIVHNLIAPPPVTFRKIRRVFSHPVALNQCLDFFARNPQIEKVPYYDTAGSVEMLMEEKLTDAGAIASALSAPIYGGHILKRSIEDDPHNYTRFFLLRRRDPKRKFRADDDPRTWKTSLVFTVRNVPGALFRALSAFALRDINLTKIESRPLRGKPWEYLFYVDLIGQLEDPNLQNALRHLQELTDLFRVLGCYRRAH